VARPGTRPDLSQAEAALTALEARWSQEPFVAPQQNELAAEGLGPRELATAVAEGRLIEIADGVVLQPRAPALAMRALAGLRQPFTVSEARSALGTTRRVAVPLLEHLDARGWTVRVDARLRRVSGR
jgi:selenocysteine-specific elongation factor